MQFSIERFDLAVFPGASELDEERLDTGPRVPLANTRRRDTPDGCRGCCDLEDHGSGRAH